MGRYWWTVWIKVAVLAVALLFAYRYAKGFVVGLFEPYLLEESVQVEADTQDSDLVKQVFGKIEEKFDVKIDYENMIFDYANEYAQTMMKQSVEERNVIDGALDEK